MGDYRQYVTFDVPERAQKTLRDAALDPDNMVLKGPDRIKTELALAEIASTPEGEKMLRDAAAKSVDGKIPVLHGGTSGVLTSGMIIVGSDDRDFQYKIAGSNNLRHDDFLQNMLVHEIAHINLEHAKKLAPDEVPGVASLMEEAEAIRTANAYIEKYYNAPLRDEDTSGVALMMGTKEWDYNTTRLAAALNAMTPEQVKAAGPEVQSLYEFRSDPKRLSEQLETMAEDGSLESAKDELLKIIADAPLPAAAPKPQPQPAAGFDPPAPAA